MTDTELSQQPAGGASRPVPAAASGARQRPRSPLPVLMCGTFIVVLE